MMDYKLLAALTKVVETGGFDKAAKQMCITQSAVSQRVKLLEDQVGQVLIARTVPPRPTAAGLSLIKHFRQVSRLEADLMEDLVPGTGEGFHTLAIGLNADSLITWFPAAVNGILASEPLLLDLRTDDQDETHRMLRNGDVVGCISAKNQPMQGCAIHPLGRMTYRMLASPGYVARWFADGVTAVSVAKAPVLVFNRKDALQDRYFTDLFGYCPDYPAHYVPSATEYFRFALRGAGCGMIPDLQSEDARASGDLVEVVAGQTYTVDLFWHCWNIDSRLLKRFTNALVREGGRLLSRFINGA